MTLRYFLAGALAGLATAAVGAAQNDGPACAVYPRNSVENSLPNGYPFDALKAVTLFRFHRQAEALAELDRAREIVRGPWRWRLQPDQRKELASTLDALRACLARTSPPRLATLTVRVLGDAPTGSRSRPQPGARLHVEEIVVGRADKNGRLTARVPSGRILVLAEVPIGHASYEDISLRPGESRAIDITLSEGKEVSERTTLVLEEAADDIVPVAATSLTLKFVKDGRLAPIASIDEVDLLDRDGNLLGRLDGHFRVERGAIVAANGAAVLAALERWFEKTIYLRVQAMSSGGLLHYDEIAFRVGQSPLTVTLAAPPSNPSLPVSNIDVGISLVGAGIAMQRTSDANGRLEVASLPHGTIALECETVVDGKYYYCDGTAVHSGSRSVTLVPRHVDDLKKGAPAIR
jgi:hypothetical protein